MIITVPRDFAQHHFYSNGMRVPANLQLFEGQKHSVVVELDKYFPCISVGNLSGRKIKESDAIGVIQKFGVTKFERFHPPHPHTAIYFKILNE